MTAKTTIESPDGKPIKDFRRKSEWLKWREKNHDKSSGVWLRMAKKDSGLTSISRNDALDVALCYGWIDGQARSEGETTWLQKYTPRTKRSIWSKINRDKVNALIESGDMRPAGLKEIERAKADGRWDAAYDSSKTITIPEDLQAAFDKNKKAKKFFETLDSRNRYATTQRRPRRERSGSRSLLRCLAAVRRSIHESIARMTSSFSRPFAWFRGNNFYCFTFVSTAIQLTSQFFPPSSENACSNLAEVAVTS
jgi:uncharacterized protein YdeI (YjbR/CyaY-like superfamily)